MTVTCDGGVVADGGDDSVYWQVNDSAMMIVPSRHVYQQRISARLHL